MIDQVTIIGLGLIGGSFGLSIQQSGKIKRIAGYDISLPSIQEAVSRNAVNWGTTSKRLAVQEADIVVIATPVGQILQMVKDILPYLKKDCIITDVGSTKKMLADQISSLLPPGISYVGGHPMAGSEKGGITEASPYLFENAIFCLTPGEDTPEAAVAKVKYLAELIGAKVKIISPEIHDQMVAGVSHLPYMVAVSLVNAVSRLSKTLPDTPVLAAGGFRDTTRVAGGDPVMWSDIALSNSQHIVAMIDIFQKELNDIKEEILHGEAPSLRHKFKQAQDERAKVPSVYKGLLPENNELILSVPDKPGMLSLITGSLSEFEINIAEIEVLHARENEGGAIRLAFLRKLDMEKAEEIFNAKGLKAKRR